MGRRAVIVGVGESIQRWPCSEPPLEPVDLMAQAMRAAQADSRADILGQLDRVDLVGMVSWSCRNPVALLCGKLGIDPAHCSNAGMGGETPLRLIHDAALAIARGDSRAAAIVGGEAAASRATAGEAGLALDWTAQPPPDEAVRHAGSACRTGRPARDLQMQDPDLVYPFYEVASTAAWGETPGQAREAAASLWARYAQVAAQNPGAWRREAPDADRIARPGTANRMVAWPYPELMLANPAVNMASAVLVMEETLALALGVAREAMIHVWGGAAAAEDEDYLARDRYDHCPAQAAVLDAALALAGGVQAIGPMELYSGSPVVPRMALRHMGLEESQVLPTVTGGMSFFGGPPNTYMGHATAAMVRRLRQSRDKIGLLYGQGGCLTRHHALVLGHAVPAAPLARVYSVQTRADRARMPAPSLIEIYRGPARVESYTVCHDRQGAPIQGVVIARTPAGERLMARVLPDDDAATMARLIDLSATQVGATGQVRRDAFGHLVFTLAPAFAPRPRRGIVVAREGALTIITIARPDCLNCIDPATNAELAEAFDAFEADAGQWVAILTGAGDKAFSAGNDLKATTRLMQRGQRVELPESGFGGLTARFGMTKPVIAAVNGLAVGGGFEMALAADLLIAEEHASFALPEPKVGLAALAGGLLRLPAHVGHKRAMDLILTGRSVSASEGHAMGFVNEVVPKGEGLAAARRWAQTLLELSPLSLRASKQVVQRGAQAGSLQEAYREQARYPAVRALLRSQDMREGPAAFAQKRKPQWKGE